MTNPLVKVYKHYTIDLAFFRRMEWKIIVKWLNPVRGEIIGDIGCGSGAHCWRLSKKGCFVLGIDIDEKAINEAIFYNMLNGRTQYCLGRAEDLPCGQNSFDKIYSISAVEHFQDDQKALMEMRRVLKPCGILVLSVDSFSYYSASDKIKIIHRKRFFVNNYYTKSSLAEKLRQSGFEVLKTKYILNSKVSGFFFELGIKIGHAKMFSPLAYPLSRICDKFFGRKNEGYILIVKARKI